MKPGEPTIAELPGTGQGRQRTPGTVAATGTGTWGEDADARWDKYTQESEWPPVVGGRPFPPGLGGGGGGGGGCLMTLLLWPLRLGTWRS